MYKTMDDYIDYLNYLASNKVDQNFKNNGEEKALEVLVRIFELSNTHIRIFAANLCSHVPNNERYISELSRFIEAGGKLQVLLNEFAPDDVVTSPLFKRLAYLKHEGKDIDLRNTDIIAHYANDLEKKPIHFTVGDESAYRVENNIKDRTADCNFNNEAVTKGIIAVFDSMFKDDRSKDIDLMSIFGLK